MQRGRNVASCGVAVAVCALGASGDTIVVPASRDNTLYESSTGTISNGQGPYFFVGVTATGLIRRGLLRFDLSAIPPGSTITAARLHLNMSKTIAFDTDVSLHRALKDWGEGASTTGFGQGGGGAPAEAGDATWLHRSYDLSFWAMPGGTPGGLEPDYIAAASAITAVGNPTGFYTWGPGPGIVADVQGWTDNPASNFGWFVVGDETEIVTAKRFDSRENSAPANWPRLEVTFEPCYANCDGSTAAPILNVNDFICFNNRYQVGDSYGNCDGSTVLPVLNVNDYLCFLNRYASGCGGA